METGSVFPPPHPSFVDSDLDEPSSELRLAAKILNMLQRFQECFLENLFGIRLVLQDSMDNPVNASFMAVDQRRKGFFLPLPDTTDQFRIAGFVRAIHTTPHLFGRVQDQSLTSSHQETRAG